MWQVTTESGVIQFHIAFDSLSDLIPMQSCYLVSAIAISCRWWNIWFYCTQTFCARALKFASIMSYIHSQSKVGCDWGAHHNHVEALLRCFDLSGIQSASALWLLKEWNSVVIPNRLIGHACPSPSLHLVMKHSWCIPWKCPTCDAVSVLDSQACNREGLQGSSSILKTSGLQYWIEVLEFDYCLNQLEWCHSLK